MPITLQCPQCKKTVSIENSGPQAAKRDCPACKMEMVQISGGLPDFIATADEEVRDAYINRQEVISGKYVIIKKIGEGGMGKVFKGWDITLKRYVAIKMISISSENSPAHDEAVQRFIREAQTSARLSHPNILQVYEVGRHQDNYFICMEYVDGGTLDEYWCQRQGFSKKSGGKEVTEYEAPSKKNINEYVKIMKKVMEGIDYAHRENIIHRDLKPENVLLVFGKKGEVIPKVSDFGLAKEVSSKSNLTVAGTVVGTPAYMSPEQANGEELDGRSDIFSLGSLLYKICAGRPPFDGESLIDIIKAVIFKDPVASSKLNKSVDNDLELIIIKAMEKEKERRYQSAGEFADDVDRYLNGEPIKARPVSLTYQLTKKIKRNKAGFAGIAAGVIILLSVLAGLWVQSAGKSKLAREYLARADKLFSENSWDKAKEEYIKCLQAKKDGAVEARIAECQKNIDDAKAKEQQASREVQRGWLYATQIFPEFYKKDANMEKVWAHIDQAIKIIDDSLSRYQLAEGYFYKAMLQREKGRLKEAEISLTAAIRINPDYEMAYALRGIVYVEQYLQRYFEVTKGADTDMKSVLAQELEKKALADFKKITGAGAMPDQFEKYKPLFEAMRLYSVDSATCVALLKKGYEKYGSEDFLFWLAVCYMNIGNFETATDYITKALEKKTQFAEGYMIKAKMNMDRDKYEEAERDISETIRINPDHASAYNFRSMTKYMKGDYKGALEDIDISLRLNEKNPIPLYNRGVINMRVKNFREAFSDFSRLIVLTPEDPMAYYERGFARTELGDSAGGIDDFTAAIAKKPDPEFYLRRGLIRYKTGDAKGGLADYDMVIKLKPDCTEAYFSRGLARKREGDAKGAIADMTEYLKTVKNDAQVYVARALVRDSIGDINGVIEDFTAAAKITPDNPEIFGNRGLAKYNLKDIKGSIEDMTEAIRLTPEEPRYYFWRGMARLQTGDLDGSIEDNSYVIKMKPDNYDSYYNRALAKFKKNDHKGAIEDCSSSIAIMPDNTKVFSLRADAKAAVGDLRGAYDDSSIVIKIEPKNADNYACRAKLQELLGVMEGAKADYSMVIQLEPNNAEANYKRGVIKYNSGDYDGALEDYFVAMNNDPQNDGIYLSIGVLKARKNELESALAYFGKAAEINPKNAVAFSNCASTMSKLGDLQNAIKYAEKAMELNPKLGSAYNTRGMALYKMGQYENALKDLEKAVELDPSLKAVTGFFIDDLKQKLQVK
ncbi:MAG: tetratricopeptide repeat protein [Planctomycetes bacterium]|nr:tetratricopeptide repeat protein [Planctomycetota bacterium]